MTIRCYHCNGLLDENDMVIKPIPFICKNGKVRNYKRKFHMECLQEYMKNSSNREVRKSENDDWSKVYEYYKSEIMRYPETSNLSIYEVRRLNGLRVGSYMPNGNTRIVKKGYSYKTILLTMQFSKAVIVKYIDTHKFHDGEHKINYVMSVLGKNLDFIAEKMRLAQEIGEMTQSNRKLAEYYKNNFDEYIKDSSVAGAFRMLIKEHGEDNLLEAFGLVVRDGRAMDYIKSIEGTHRLNYIRKIVAEDKLPELKRRADSRKKQIRAVNDMENEITVSATKYKRKGGKRHLNWLD